VEDFILPYSAVYLRIQKWKNYWNRSTFAKVIVKIKVAQFSLTHSVYFWNQSIYSRVRVERAGGSSGPVGSTESEISLQPVLRPRSLFVTRLPPDVTAEDLTYLQFVAQVFKLDATCTKIAAGEYHSSFKVTVCTTHPKSYMTTVSGQEPLFGIIMNHVNVMALRISSLHCRDQILIWLR